jgi:hypothetical protein
MRLILAMLCVVAGACAEDFGFETGLVRYVLGADGTSRSLVEKATGRDWLAAPPAALFSIRKGGKTFAGSSIRREGELLRVDFQVARADYRISARADYLVVELVRIEGEGVEEVVLAEVRPRPETAGYLLAVRWNDQFAVCLMALSDRVNSRLEPGGLLVASVYPEFGMEGQKVALIAAPATRFPDVVRQVERDFGIPHTDKRSPDVRTSYLFTDLTEANADETIRYAKLGGFKYVMAYDSAWSTSHGSYPINTRNFPGGEESLKATIDKCHAAGLKVGIHMVTSFVGKNDPLVRPKPDPRLLKDAVATLAADIDAKATEIPAAEALADFPIEGAFYGGAKAGRDIQIDDELIQYRAIDGQRFLRVIRGFSGTQAAPHKAGAKISHLAERYYSYLADLRTPLKEAISERIAGVINRCGFDMIYFDGGEVNGADGPYWYWVSQQQEDIFKRVKRDLVVQGSGMTHYTWHVFSRGNCDDFSALAPKQYLDYHKIGDTWNSHHNNFLPAELGWWGFLEDTPDHPATTPDEVEYYAVRMLALDTPVSLETNLAKLKANGRTEEMLRLLAKYEDLRLGGKVPEAVREKLRTGEWHMDGNGFRPMRRETELVEAPGEVRVVNEFGRQPLKFRIQALPRIAAGDPENIVLVSEPVDLEKPEAKAHMPGSLAGRTEFPQPKNLLGHRALAVTLEVEEPSAAVLNVQLEGAAKTYREHYINLDFAGARTIVIPEPTTERTLAEFRPNALNYAFKAAMYHFSYANVLAVNFRWMRPGHCRVRRVEAMAERDEPLKDCRIAGLSIPELRTGDYAEFWGDGPVRVFDRNGVPRGTVNPSARVPVLPKGESRLALSSNGRTPLKLTVITLGELLE